MRHSSVFSFQTSAMSSEDNQGFMGAIQILRSEHFSQLFTITNKLLQSDSIYLNRIFLVVFPISGSVLPISTLPCFSLFFSVLSSSDSNNSRSSSGGAGDSARGHAALPHSDLAVCCLPLLLLPPLLPPSIPFASSPNSLSISADRHLSKTRGQPCHRACWPISTV